MLEDSYATIGLDGPAVSADSNSNDPTLSNSFSEFEDFFTIDNSNYFNTNGTELTIETSQGSSNSYPNSELQVLIMQINTTGTLSGQLTYNILSDSGEEISVFTEFDGVGNFGGINIPTCGCTLENACNYNNEA